MAPKRGLSTGGSYGRTYAILIWVEDNWPEFDTWCCIKNIDPLDLPAYRFFNLALLCIKENRNEESLKALEESLLLCDAVEHPFQTFLKGYKQRRVTVDTTKSEPNQGPQEKQKYIPPWYLGEDRAFQAAQLARSGISNLPKMG